MITRNDQIFGTGGAIGRLMYLRNGIILDVFVMLLMLGLSVVNGCSIPILFKILWSVCSLLPVVVIYVYFDFANVFKRLRDIQGDDNPSKAWLVLYLVPGVNILFYLFLLFIPGRGPGKGLR